jgi:hypothetical protein
LAVALLRDSVSRVLSHLMGVWGCIWISAVYILGAVLFLMRSVLSIVLVTLGKKRYVCNHLPKVTSLLMTPKSSVL